MAVAHDAASEREADPPPFLLGRESRIEDLIADLARYAGSVVRHANANATLRKCFGGYLHPAVTPRQRIDRILREGLERSFEQHRISLNHELALV